jgi:quinol monooxygenase YgiN
MRAFLLGLGCLIATLGAAAAQPQTTTFYTVTYLEVGPAAAGRALAPLKSYRDAGRKDAGNVGLTLLQRIDRTSQFVVRCAWTDQKAYETHAAGDAAKRMHEALRPLSIAPPDTRQHSALTVAPERSDSRGAVFAITHVDVIPTQKDNAIAALKTLVDVARKQSGNLRYDIWQQTNRPNHFSSVAAWANRRAFDLHQSSAPAKDFRAKLAGMTGALYDERLYRVVK